MTAFRILLKIHTPLIMPRVAPRLPRLLAEALSRCHGDWTHAHELPIAPDTVTGFKGSQLILATRPTQPLAATTVSLPDFTDGLDFLQVRKPPGPFKEGSANHPRRFTKYPAIQTPYAFFYGVGDGDKTARLLTLLDGLGREHMRGYGHFEVMDVQPDTENRWRQTPHRASRTIPAKLPFEPVFDHLCLEPGQAAVDVWRPRQLLREVLTW